MAKHAPSTQLVKLSKRIGQGSTRMEWVAQRCTITTDNDPYIRVRTCVNLVVTSLTTSFPNLFPDSTHRQDATRVPRKSGHLLLFDAPAKIVQRLLPRLSSFPINSGGLDVSSQRWKQSRQLFDSHGSTMTVFVPLDPSPGRELLLFPGSTRLESSISNQHS